MVKKSVPSTILPDDHDLCIRTFLGEIDRLDNSASDRTVLHVGAHMGEEVPAYKHHAYTKIFLVEANPFIAPKLRAELKNEHSVEIIEAAVADECGTAIFVVHETEKGGMESGSLLELKLLGEIAPVFDSSQRLKVEAITLDKLIERIPIPDVLVLDIQGGELKALQGATQLLSKVRFVVCEVNLIETYEGVPSESEIDAFLDNAGFDKQYAIYHELYDDNGRFPAWGECLWQRR